jgi:regulator of protease activity HflC (stomatin/prohibitin superfamily)
LLGFTVLAISGLLVHYTWDQWLLVSLVALLWMLCALQPLPISLLYMLGSAFVGLGFAAIALRPLYGGNIWAAIQAAISLILGEPLSLQVVTPPESIRQAGTPDRFGPRRVIVKPNTAVVMEVGSRQTRILGPTVVVTEPYEYVQMIYSLQPHHRTLWYPHVLTQDLIASEVRVGITFGLGVEWDAREGLRPLLAAERNNIQLFHICAANWEDELTTVLEAVVRNVIGNQRFEQATDAAFRQAIEQEITTRLQGAATQWGIALHRTQLIAVQPDAQVHQAREQRFLSQTNAETIALYERARAQAWGEALAALGEAYADAKDNGLPDTIIVREMLRRLMEQATSHVATQNMFPRVLRQAFDELEGARPTAPNGNGPAGANTPGP